MQFQSNKGYSPVGQLGFLLLFTGLGFIAAGLVQIPMLLTKLPMQDVMDTSKMMKILTDPANSTLVRWMQVISTFFLFCVPALLFSLVCNGKKIFWLGFNSHLSIIQIALGFVIIFVANLGASIFQVLTEYFTSFAPKLKSMADGMEYAYNSQVQAISHFNTPMEFVISLVIMAFLPAIFEELFFRGALQQVLMKWLKNPLFAIIITALIFSLIHRSIYLFFSRAILGFVLGLIFYYTKNIWVNIIAHFLNNAVALFQLYYLQLTHHEVNVSKMEDPVHPLISIHGLISVFALFILIKEISEKNKLRIYAREQALLVNQPSGHPIA